MTGIDDRNKMELVGLAIDFLTTDQIKAALQDPDNEICEWKNAGLTFVFSKHVPHVRRPTIMLAGIVRAGAMGADTRNIHGGWRYLTHNHAEHDWKEIKNVAPCYDPEQFPHR